MATVHASLNGQGYTKDPTIIADELFGEAIYSRYSQSEMFFGKIISLDYLIEQFADDAGALCTNLESSYDELFGRHFDNVTTQAVSTDIENSNYYSVVLKIRYSREGLDYDFARVIQYYNGVVKKITEILDQ